MGHYSVNFIHFIFSQFYKSPSDQSKQPMLMMIMFTKVAFMLSHFSSVWLFATLWTVACQAPLSMGFFRQEYWMGCHFLLQGIFPTWGFTLGLLHCRQILYCWATREALTKVICLMLDSNHMDGPGCLYTTLYQCQLNNKYCIAVHVDNIQVKIFYLDHLTNLKRPSNH